MNKKELQQKLNELEITALDYYCDYNNICVRDYVNADVMGILDYQSYVELYYQLNGECFECGQNPCDEGCGYQVSDPKGKIEMYEELSDFISKKLEEKEVKNEK